jgi:hypothetical protein
MYLLTATLTVGVAGANSASASDAIATFPVNFETGKYIRSNGWWRGR